MWTSVFGLVCLIVAVSLQIFGRHVLNSTPPGPRAWRCCWCCTSPCSAPPSACAMPATSASNRWSTPCRRPASGA
ncbi:hypothetical protein WJ971_08370 [Achromobacter xylosoxidans]